MMYRAFVAGEKSVEGIKLNHGRSKGACNIFQQCMRASLEDGGT